MKIKKYHTIKSQFRMILFGILLITLVVTSLLLGSEVVRVVGEISHDYGTLNSQELVNKLDSYILPDIALSQHISESLDIEMWLRDEHNPTLKEHALEELKSFVSVSKSKNAFIASALSGNMYYIDLDTTISSFLPAYKLSTANTNDRWFFETMAQEKAFNLNIDLDRYLETMKVWVNTKIVSKETSIGVMGTGLNLDVFLTSILKHHSQGGFKTILINQFGVIQLDSNLENVQQHSFEGASDRDKTLYRYFWDEAFQTAVEGYLKDPPESLSIDIEDATYDFVTLAPIHHTNWHVVSFYSESTLFSSSTFTPLIFVSIAILLILTFFMNILVDQTWVKPFGKLGASLEAISYDSDQALYGLERMDEFGDLARGIKDLSNRLISNVPVGLFLLNQDFHLTYANPFLLNQFGLSERQALQAIIQSNPQALMVNLSDMEKIKDLIHSLNKALNIDRRTQTNHGYQNMFTCELQLMPVMQDMKPFWAEIHFSLVRKADGQINYEGILINITAKKAHEDHLITVANTDVLTSLLNRRAYEQIVQAELLRAVRYGHAVSMIMFDLDNFKLINDTYGHDIGDQVLWAIANEARNNIRKLDTLARWGGEEFLILLPETDLVDAFGVAEKLRKALSYFEHDVVGAVTASFGVSQWRTNEPYSGWFNRVDQSLLKAKVNGRNQTVSVENLELGQEQAQLIWHSRFESGNPLIDQQHQDLFVLANRAIKANHEDFGFEEQIECLVKFVEQLRRHFADEELELVAFNCPTDVLREHKIAHRQLMEKMESMIDQHQRLRTVFTDVLVLLVHDMILDHMMQEDMKFFPLMKQGKR